MARGRLPGVPLRPAEGGADLIEAGLPRSCGFDVVLGNPPWERIKLQEQEFFAERSPSIAGARNAAERKRMIVSLETADPALWSIVPRGPTSL